MFTKKVYTLVSLVLMAFLLGSSRTPTMREYLAILSQAGTNAPEVTVIKNDLGADVVWTRMVAGKYRATLQAGFPLGKTYVPNNLSVYPGSYVIYTDHFNNNYVDVYSEDWNLEMQDGLIQEVMIEIRVYP